MKPAKHKKKRGSWISKLGPGLVTGASDDDPSGIATYSQAGAKYGTRFLWTALFLYPMMVSIQETCARIGLVTKKGIMGSIRSNYPKPLMYLILMVSIPSVIFNIGADIAGMGAVGAMLVPQIPAPFFSVAFTAVLLYAVIIWSYPRIAKVLKWLCVSLFCYLVIPFMTTVDWSTLLKDTFVPTFTANRDFFMVLVGILGTTISPYLFFWQATMEVEESKHALHVVVDKAMIREMDNDVQTGMLLTNVVFYFIILSTGTVLFHAGKHEIQTVEEAAEALRPLAGPQSYLLFALGVIGTGLLAIPVLAGSLSYMVAEAFGWEEGLDKKFHDAPGFYITLSGALVCGLLIQFLEVSPVKALFYAAVLYGITAPVIIAVILHLANSAKVMGKFRNTAIQNLGGFITFAVMAAAAITLVCFTFSDG